MEWLKALDRETVFKYESENGDTLSGTLEELGCDLKGGPGETVQVGENTYTYAGFEPRKLSIENRVEYDQNGRKAIQITRKNGERQYISQSKLHYMKTGRIQNQYTKEFEAHLVKTSQEQLLKTDQYISKAKIIANKERETMIQKGVPGHYIPEGSGWRSPDGEHFIPRNT